MSKYWQERAKEREAQWYEIATAELDEKVKRYYASTLESIRRDIESLYARYAGENGLTMLEARRLIRGKEYKAWRMALEEYVAAAQNDSAILKELNTLAMRSRISRLEKLMAETLIEVDKLCEKTNNFLTDFLTQSYYDNYYRNLYEVHKGYGLKTSPVAVDSKKVEGVIRSVWSGANYSARIWKNGLKLEKAIERTVLTGIHRGISVQKLSKELSREMEVGYNNAERLVRTELNFVQNKASLDSIASAGLEHYQFMAALDRRTCPRCGSLDGRIFEVEESMPGENFPPLHPRCRCTVCTSLGEVRGKRIAERRVKLDGNVTYEQWKAKYIEKVMPKTSVNAVKLEPKTLEEAQKVAERMNEIVGKYVVRPSKWSGKVVYYSKGTYKAPSCDILVNLKDCPDDAILHEMLHSCSASYFPNAVYKSNSISEEASVQYLTQEISLKEGISITPSAYDKYVNILREFQSKAKLYKSDFDFALELFNQPVDERIYWLKMKISEFVMANDGDFSKYWEFEKLIGRLEGSIFDELSRLS